MSWTGIQNHKTAVKRGNRRYITGKPCKRGHTCARYTSNGYCIACSKGLKGRKEKLESLRKLYIKTVNYVESNHHPIYQPDDEFLKPLVEHSDMMFIKSQIHTDIEMRDDAYRKQHNIKVPRRWSKNWTNEKFMRRSTRAKR